MNFVRTNGTDPLNTKMKLSYISRLISQCTVKKAATSLNRAIK